MYWSAIEAVDYDLIAIDPLATTSVFIDINNIWAFYYAPPCSDE